jgi:hypothetical protein
VSEGPSTPRRSPVLGRILRLSGGAAISVVRVFKGPCVAPRAREAPIQAHSPIEHEGCDRADQQSSYKAHQELAVNDYTGVARSVGQRRAISRVVIVRDILDFHRERRAHQANQSTVTKPRVRAHVDALQQFPRLLGREHWGLALLHDVLRATQGSSGSPGPPPVSRSEAAGLRGAVACQPRSLRRLVEPRRGRRPPHCERGALPTELRPRQNATTLRRLRGGSSKHH